MTRSEAVATTSRTPRTPHSPVSARPRRGTPAAASLMRERAAGLTAAEYAAAEAAFLAANPRFAATASVDALRRTDYRRIDAAGEVYLDYTGGGLYGESQLDAHMTLLREAVFGNPHSVNPTSSAATEHVESARSAVLRFFGADQDEYECIFTPNATGALRLVGEAYPFRAGGHFLALFDNHNSVNGLREFARAKGTTTRYVPVEAPELRVPDDVLDRYLADPGAAGSNL